MSDPRMLGDTCTDPPEICERRRHAVLLQFEIVALAQQQRDVAEWIARSLRRRS